MRSLALFLVLLVCSVPRLTAQTSAVASAEQRLMEAAFSGELEEVQRRVSEGADVNAADPENRTSLMWAAFNGHAAVIDFLLDEGGELDGKDSSGRTALMYASSGPFAEAVGRLLERGAEVNVQGTQEGFTALMTAAAEGQVEVVRLLLEHGADLALEDKDGDTARSFAQSKGHAAVVELLDNPPSAKS